MSQQVQSVECSNVAADRGQGCVAILWVKHSKKLAFEIPQPIQSLPAKKIGGGGV
jgi:hypothetical protein